MNLSLTSVRNFIWGPSAQERRTQRAFDQSIAEIEIRWDAMVEELEGLRLANQHAHVREEIGRAALKRIAESEPWSGRAPQAETAKKALVALERAS